MQSTPRPSAPSRGRLACLLSPRFSLLGVLAAVALFASPVSASLAEALDLRELVRRSSHVVTATAVSHQALYDAHGRIVTDVTLEVGESMRGAAQPGDRLVVRCMGGQIGEIGMRIEGEARFTDGEESLLFLAPGRSGALRPVGMSQGVMRIDRGGAEAVVLPGGEGLSLVSRVAGGRIAPAPAALIRPEPLRVLLRRVESLSSELPALPASSGATHE